MAASTFVTIQPVSPAALGINFSLLGDSTYNQASSSGGVQIVERPKLVAATQWLDRAPFQITLPLRLDSFAIFGNNNTSIEGLCLTVESWLDPAPGTLDPPVLSISGPVPGVQRQWWLYTVTFKEAIRDPQAGFRVQQDLDIVMYEYNSPLETSVYSTSPANAAAAALDNAESSQSYSLYYVAAGDTLSSIAASQLGNYTAWVYIALLNGIRDPNTLVPGQIIKIPIQ